VGRGSALGVDDPELAMIALVVLLDHPLQRHGAGCALVEQREADALPGDVGIRLRRERTDAGDGRGDGVADGEELRGDRDTPGGCRVRIAPDR
jgi:hypothetical protein